MEEKKNENENEKLRGGKFRFTCVYAWVGIFPGRARGRARVCKNETLMGKTFGLPENRDYFSLLPTLARKAKFPPFLHY